MEFLLIHSPLVGPTTWRWVAEALSTAGHEVLAPDLRASAECGKPRAFISAAASATPSEWSSPVIVGHSGAGFFLPSIASQVDAVMSVFVDAGLPPVSGSAKAGGDFLDHLRSLAVDGALPRWSTWWGDEVMEALVPDDVRRAELETEMREIPLEFYDTPVDLPRRWSDARASFLLLSEAYRADAQQARSLGWPLIERLGSHLDVVNDPDAIARAVIQLTM